jgi:asparagine synthase (glutamine-hydrolysing)
MIQYLAFFWDIRSVEQSHLALEFIRRLQSASRTWANVFAAPGITVNCNPASTPLRDIHLISDASGVVLGPLFRNNSDINDPTRCCEVGSTLAECKTIAASEGRDLVSRFWGSYAAFIFDPITKKRWLISAPTSDLPCFSASYRGLTIICSRLEDCHALEIPFSVNWNDFSARVAANLLFWGKTPLDNVTEIYPGECLSFDGAKRETTAYWNPCSLSQTDIVEDPLVATRAARATMKSCTHAWAARYEDLLLQLSGGVDSSVVLGCLSDAPTRPKVTCLNLYSAGCNGDERRYARVAAQQAGCRLIESKRQSSTNLRGMTAMARCAIPAPYFIDYALNRPIVQTARELGAKAQFTGNLGDVVFYFYPPAEIVTDFLHYHSIGPRALTHALNAAILTRTSVLKILGHAVRQSWRQPTPAIFFRDIIESVVRDTGSLVCAEPKFALLKNLRANDDMIHPWFRSDTGPPLGKLNQLLPFSLSRNEDPFASPGDPEAVHPFASQPIVDLCLRIPTYTHMYNGWDRAISRQAFTGDVPNVILQRTTKGGMEEYATELINCNGPFLKELLLDGTLIREKLVDGKRLEAVLSRPSLSEFVYPSEILTYATMEIWLSTWASGKYRAAA